MSKRMFVVVEVEEHGAGAYGFVYPLGSNWPHECIRKSRVIYADEMIEDGLPGERRYTFHGVSSSPEPKPKDEWEEWVEEAAKVFAPFDEMAREAIRKLLRKMPRREKA